MEHETHKVLQRTVIERDGVELQYGTFRDKFVFLAIDVDSNCLILRKEGSETIIRKAYIEAGGCYF